jgi:hypothetical protein
MFILCCSCRCKSVSAILGLNVIKGRLNQSFDVDMLLYLHHSGATKQFSVFRISIKYIMIHYAVLIVFVLLPMRFPFHLTFSYLSECWTKSIDWCLQHVTAAGDKWMLVSLVKWTAGGTKVFYMKVPPVAATDTTWNDHISRLDPPDSHKSKWSRLWHRTEIKYEHKIRLMSQTLLQVLYLHSKYRYGYCHCQSPWWMRYVQICLRYWLKAPGYVILLWNSPVFSFACVIPEAL